MEYNNTKGLGDSVSSLIQYVSRGRIRECGGCKKRKEWLNHGVPYSTLRNLWEKQNGK